MEQQRFCLRWNSFHETMASAFGELRNDEEFVDVTIACGGQHFKAHKVVLSACSQYFRQLFKSNPCQHPIVFMRDITPSELSALLQFMYNGQASIEQEKLPQLLQAAEALQVKGLAEISQQQDRDLDDPPSVSRPNSVNIDVPEADHSRSASPTNKRKKQLPLLQSILSERPTGGDRTQSNGMADLSKGAMGNADQVDSDENEDMSEPDDSRYESGEDSLLPSRMVEVSSSEQRTPLLPPLTPVSALESGFLSAATKLQAVASALSQESHMQSNSLSLLTPAITISDIGGGSGGGDMAPRKLAFHEPRPCPVCLRIYRDAATLRTHTAIMHTEGQTPFYCSCGAPFGTKYEMYIHKKNGHKSH
ncbi:unnamed protein product [Darwinula stevensoni]|uniref:BTB domain-containing protein n=1 Tax=Darwinula stevensoni TaxID=69355 RepID=A0A7R9A024_9CRUS|nr:unnamed protein product [Darwinula stevensoni]CAG0884699.1 unnamed protein product [Darwinula stevensoni]